MLSQVSRTGVPPMSSCLITVRRVIGLIAAGLPFAALASTLTITVTGNGAPLSNAVVSLLSSAGTATERPSESKMDQLDFQFEPHVLAVRVGTMVRFPNSDHARHHVYSFSPAKVFELPLYSGQPANPILFDKPGVVELGCNIHDWMLGYVVVVDTPYFGVTGKDGKVQMQLPRGQYKLQVWHEWQKEGQARTGRRLLQVSSASAEEHMDIEIVPKSPPKKGPMDDPQRKSPNQLIGPKLEE